MSPLSNAGVFVVQTLFDLYILIVLLRLLFQIVRADFYNPLSQFIVKATNPIIVPMRRCIPGYAGIDLSSVLLLIALTMIKITILTWINAQIFPNFIGLILWSAGDLLRLFINTFFWSIIIYIVLSWISPGGSHPFLYLLYRLCEPLLQPARKIIPPIAGLDVSPILVIMMLKLLSILFADPIVGMGQVMSLS